jgi:hypothetical protein
LNNRKDIVLGKNVVDMVISRSFQVRGTDRSRPSTNVEALKLSEVVYGFMVMALDAATQDHLRVPTARERETEITSALLDKFKKLLLCLDADQRSEKLEAWLSTCFAPSKANLDSKLTLVICGKCVAT